MPYDFFWFCAICSSIYRDDKRFFEHIKSHKYCPCSACLEPITNLFSMDYNICFSESCVIGYGSAICKQNDVKKFVQHISGKTALDFRISKFVCRKCGFVTTDHLASVNHLCYKCDVCFDFFPTKRAWLEHIHIYYKELKCLICNKHVFLDREDYKRHVNSHDVFKCFNYECKAKPFK